MQSNDRTNFNPRTREGCDYTSHGSIKTILPISIHAPVKGATFARAIARGVTDYISIHAPVKGATPQNWESCQRLLDFNPRTREGCDKTGTNTEQDDNRHFNPRTREGCDRRFWRHDRSSRNISIHAPVKGATIYYARSPRPALYFNPRTREGCDPL